MALAITGVIRPWQLPGFSIALVKLTFSGSYSTGGDACVVDSTVFPGVLNKADIVKPLTGAAGGYILEHIKSTDKMKIWCNTAGAADAALGEHTAAAVSAGVTGATIYALCVWFSPAMP